MDKHKQARIEQLATEIRYHNEKFFLDDAPEISDDEFDMMMVELKNLDPENDVFAEVGARMDDIDDNVKVKHTHPMGSLSKAHSVNEVVAWAKQFVEEEILISRKMDGLAVTLHYENSQLVLAATRGDGNIGEDVTENARYIDDIHEELDGFSGEVRGEVYMSKETFNRLVEEAKANGGRIFANPRNAAAGSLRQFKHPEITGQRGLSFVAYDIVSNEHDFETQKDKAGLAELLGIDYVKFVEYHESRFETIAKDAGDRRRELPYCIDGLVLTVNSLKTIEREGMVGNSLCPRAKIAFKFPAEEAKAKVVDIEWQVGRTGKITPVAILEPTYVDGSTVSRATLHNHANIVTLDLGIDDVVRFCKSGDIIPYIMKVEERAEERRGCNYPIDCPSCGVPTERDEVNAVCLNPTCPAQLEAKILHWLRRVDVKGIGARNIAAFREAGLLHSQSDLYRLDVDSIKEITGGEKSAQKIIDAVKSVKEVPLWMFLAGLGIPALGRTTSKVVAKQYKILFNVLTATTSDLMELEGIGEITASHIVSGLRKMTGIIAELQGFVKVLDEVEKEGCLKGSSFCITGSISMGKNTAHKMIENAGGEAWTSVKKGLTYLVTDDPNSTSAKMKKAVSLGVQIIDETKMVELING